MKKILLIALCSLFFAKSFAQFEQGKKFVGASVSNLDLSYSDLTDLNLGLNATAGYMFEQDLMLLGEIGFNYSNSNCQSISAAARFRYYIEQNGLYLSMGARLIHQYPKYNDLQLLPEVGYAFFISRTVTIEPALYYDISLTDFAHKSKAGLKIGFGIYLQ